MADKSPAFQFYPKDFLTDERVRLMSHTERGIYITLLCLCWLETTLPLETDKLAKLVEMPLPRFTKVWENSVLRQCFHVEDDGRLHHKRLDEEREKHEEFRRRQSDKGKASAAARSVSPVQPEVNRGSTGFQPPVAPEGNSSSATASAISDLQTASRAAVAISARSKRPIYQSDRFAVFEWQLDELMRTLGPHVDGFDLHGFFDDLSQQSRLHGLVIPGDRDERWKWLQAAVEAEARRRGLPMALADTAPTNTRIANLTRGGQKFLERSAQ